MVEHDHPEQHSGHHPWVGFIYLYLHYFSLCVGLILLHFLMAPAWVCLYVYFLFSNILFIILGGVDMTTSIYKAAAVTLDEDLASQVKRKKEVEMETESLRKRLNMLHLEVHEEKARDAKINVETAVLLAKSASLDEELTTHSNLKGGKYLTRDQGADNSGPVNELIEEDDEEEIIYKPPFQIV